MIKFIYDVFHQTLKITQDTDKGIEILQDGIVLDPKGFEFRLQKYAENYMDEHDLDDNEYQVLIRIH